MGIVVGKSSRIEFYKKAIACWKDPKYIEYYDVDADFLLLHARKAPDKAIVSDAFTHPFKRCWFFCHNGTVTDFVKPNTSDSERFFELLLEKIEEKKSIQEAIEVAIRQLKEYTAPNFILANNRKAYILNR